MTPSSAPNLRIASIKASLNTNVSGPSASSAIAASTVRSYPPCTLFKVLFVVSITIYSELFLYSNVLVDDKYDVGTYLCPNSLPSGYAIANTEKWLVSNATVPSPSFTSHFISLTFRSFSWSSRWNTLILSDSTDRSFETDSGISRPENETFTLHPGWTGCPFSSSRVMSNTLTSTDP